MDVLSMLAMAIVLVSVTGYANAAPLGSAEDSLDTLFAEVWDSADEETVAARGGTGMLDMVRTAREDERASRSGRGPAPVIVPGMTPFDGLDAQPKPAAGRAQPASQPTPDSQASAWSFTAFARGAPPSGPSATPTDTADATPTSVSPSSTSPAP